LEQHAVDTRSRTWGRSESRRESLQTATGTAPRWRHAALLVQADHGQGGSPPEWPITERAARLLAAGFKLSLPEVVADARQVAGWAGPEDDLFVWLRSRHPWSARRTLVYLRGLRHALANPTDQP
jgi:hypothetical protein